MSVTPETPQSRIENWLAAIAGVEGVELEEPQSRIEKWLAVIYEQGGGGSGTTDHTELSNRDAAEQHPIEAITGLAAALAALEENVAAAESTEVTMTNRKTYAVPGAPSTLTVNLSAPTVGKEYLVGINFIAEAEFVLTENAPEGHSIVWSDTPTWTAGKAYEVIYRCLWLTEEISCSHRCAEKIYYFRYYDNRGKLAREFIPCYRKSDNKPGMYETVLGTFHVNQNSTGEFAVGPDI